MNGVINLYKEKGFTSMDAVAVMRGILKERKIGHAGTLDPDAEGVLVVCVGSATKAVEMLTDTAKEYEAVMLLGKTTDTQDITGQVLASSSVPSDEEKIRSVIASYEGEIDQVPPMYSALKVGGKKLCDLARSGKTVERKERKVRIDSIGIKEIRLPYVRMKVRCGKGTYIRTLCHDIGETLGCGACMASLIRTETAGFSAANAFRLKEVEQMKKDGDLSFLLPVDTIFLNLPSVTVKGETERLALNGNKIPLKEAAKRVRVYRENGDFIGVYGKDPRGGTWKPEKMFL